jgi:hypothetical protein
MRPAQIEFLQVFRSPSDNIKLHLQPQIESSRTDRGGGYVEPLDDNLKQLMKELGAAINDTLSNSDRISEAIAKIRSSGYDVFLVLEATIGFNRRQETTGDESTETAAFDGEAELNITSQDVKFLKSLKISIDDREAS